MVRTRRAVLLTLLMIAGVVIGLACAEGILRWMGYDHPSYQTTAGGKHLPTAGFPTKEMYTYDGVTGYALVQSIHAPERGITTDEHGWRVTARPYDATRPSIVFLGDSTVFGYLSKDEDTYPYLISQMPEFAGYNIVNMGVPGYSLAHVRRAMRDKIPGIRPRLLVVQFLWPWQPWKNYVSTPDAWKNLDLTFYGQSFARRARYEPEKASGRRFALAVLLEDARTKLLFGRQVQQNFSRPTEIFDFQVPEAAEREIAADFIREFKAAAQPLRDGGTRVAFYVHPFQYTLFREEYKNLGVIGRKMFADQLHAAYLGDCILRGFSQHPSEPLFIDAEHMTKPGNAVLAGCVADVVREALAAQ